MDFRLAFLSHLLGSVESLRGGKLLLDGVPRSRTRSQTAFLFLSDKIWPARNKSAVILKLGLGSPEQIKYAC